MSRSQQKQPPPPDFKTMNSDLFSLTYGAFVMDVIRDREQVDDVNRQLEKIGYNMGQRMADDFLAKNPRIGRCASMHQLAEILAKQALKTYLGVQATVQYNAADEFQMQLDANPLGEFVEIPEEQKNLRYSQIICGAIRGALEAMHMEVSAQLISDIPQPTIVRVKFLRVLHESMPAGED
ncbi:Trafficking protein particle complex subunit [Aphelenchoides besseyi]|nr:Trafficking protein particle complex subunit [Aphelenchoides besseyi]KAI6193063.1 Trafficking protein particle complex subunit [Aphelenchoides besseyi]KAI6195713.1 Trafficking protein particle complex subunit [Aphelenchoides besseyi]KAI6216848.1 Trafficking protein particle complex subunit [Aphelenchoides besseyi]